MHLNTRVFAYYPALKHILFNFVSYLISYDICILWVICSTVHRCVLKELLMLSTLYSPFLKRKTLHTCIFMASVILWTLSHVLICCSHVTICAVECVDCSSRVVNDNNFVSILLFFVHLATSNVSAGDRTTLRLGFCLGI